MFVFKRVKPVIKNSRESQKIIDKLENFLKQESPQIVYWINEVFEHQVNSVTYDELQQAMLNGYEQQIQKWQEDYAVFVNEKLAPVWAAAIRAGAAQLKNKFAEFVFDDSDGNVKDWIRLHTGEFITNIGEDTRAAIKAILAHGQDEGWTVQRMAQAIRPCIGLTRPDAIANARYQQRVYENLLKTTSSENATRQAHEAALRYGAKQHRERADMIANTELAFAYNRGYHEGVRQAMSQGFMGACEKVWRTAGTRRVCDKCIALNGQRIGFDDPFNIAGKELHRGMHQTPPAHPRCRCVVQYVEYAPPARRKNSLLQTPMVEADEKTVRNIIPPKMTPYSEPLITKYIQAENFVLDYGHKIPISYDPESGKFVLNPTHPDIKFYDMEAVLVHEIIHRIDGDYGLSISLATSIDSAVNDSRAFILENKSKYLELFDGEIGYEMCISDIFSAITINEVAGHFKHSTEYWLRIGTTEMEIVANLMAIYLTQKKLSEKIIEGIPPLQKLYREVVDYCGEYIT